MASWKELRRLREIDPVLFAQRQDELGALDRLQDPFPLRPSELVEGGLDRLLDLGRIPLLVRLSSRLGELACARGLDAEAFDLREGPMEFLQARLDLAVPVQDRFDGHVGALRVRDRLLERASSDRLAGRVQVLERAFQIHAHVRGGRELLAGRAEHGDDPLELRLLDRLEPLLRELGPFLVTAFLDRTLRAGEHLLGGGRVGPHRARLLEDAGEVAGAAVQGALEGLLRFGPALVEGVLRLLEIEVGHVPAGPLDQVRGLRRVRAELGGRPDEVLRDPDLPRHGGGHVLPDRVEPFFREVEGALEVVVLHRRPGPREEILDRSDVPAHVLRREDEGLRLREGGRQMFLEDLLAPFPRLLGVVDRPS